MPYATRKNLQSNLFTSTYIPVVSRSAPPRQLKPVKGTSSSSPSQSSLPPFFKNRNRKSSKNDLPLLNAPEKEKRIRYFKFQLRGHSQTTWTERHTCMVREMSTNVHVRCIHGQYFVHVDTNF